MASITIRQLDEGLKKRLRLRAARNGRSMEDEVRTILRASASGADAEPERVARTGTARRSAPPQTLVQIDEQAPSGKRILLIIGGGIAAYKSLELIRRLRESEIAV